MITTKHFRRPAAALFLAAFVTGGTAATTPPDLGLEAAFHATFNSRVVLQGNVTGSSRNGVVTLTGEVLDRDDLALAVETAGSIRGVVRVESRLTVASPVPTEGADARLAHRIGRELQTRATINAARIRIAAKDGVVTLTGVADSLEQRMLIGESVRQFESVVSMQNDLRVEAPLPDDSATGEPMDDASITAQILWRLRADAVTAGLRPQARTRDGDVVLMGGPGTAAQKAYAGRIADNIRGVKSVANRILLN